jgi:hypothetical protein
MLKGVLRGWWNGYNGRTQGGLEASALMIEEQHGEGDADGELDGTIDTS